MMLKAIFHVSWFAFALFLGWSLGNDVLRRVGTPPPTA